MLTPREAAGAIQGVVRLLRLDAKGLAHFNASVEGFWTSLVWGAGLVLPFYAVQSLASYLSLDDPPASFLRHGVVEASTYTIGWVLYPLVMLSVSRLLDRGGRYFGYMVAYNWFQVPVNLAMLLLVLLAMAGVVPAALAPLLLTMLTTAAFGYAWFIARHALGVDGITAVGIVILDLLLAVMTGFVGHGVMTGWGGGPGAG